MKIVQNAWYMVTQRLVLDDLEEDAYELVAIHCAIPSYKLAFLLNKYLQMRFCRKRKDISFQHATINASYPYYQYIDTDHYTSYDLVKNTFHLKTENKNLQQDLFETTKMVTKYLIPEHKKVDYFLKISAETPSFSIKTLVSKVLQIPQIITAYSIPELQIKSKNNLIFE